MNEDLISRADAIAFIERGFKKTSTVKSILCYLATAKSAESDEIGDWIITEIQCPNCFKYFEIDCYSTGELNKCPNCRTNMRKGGSK